MPVFFESWQLQLQAQPSAFNVQRSTSTQIQIGVCPTKWYHWPRTIPLTFNNRHFAFSPCFSERTRRIGRMLPRTANSTQSRYQKLQVMSWPEQSQDFLCSNSLRQSSFMYMLQPSRHSCARVAQTKTVHGCLAMYSGQINEMILVHFTDN